MCGLMGWIGKDPKDFNKDKFNLLGAYNVERGIHSCGVATDENIVKGVYMNANFMDFIANEGYESPVTTPVVIGHTRKATIGSHTKENAHPFKFEVQRIDDATNESTNFTVIGAHNGTLKNTDVIAQKYGVNHIGRVDSQVLLEIIANDNIEVLSEYTGAAALLIYTSEEPNTMYLFRGESRTCNYRNILEPERPLFYYQESENSMYVSSMKNSLYAICKNQEDRDANVYEVETNRLYEITNGKIVKKYIISREQLTTTTRTSTRRTQSENTNNTDLSTTIHAPLVNRHQYRQNQNSRVGDTTKVIQIDKHTINNIYYEKLINSIIQQDVIYENLRYKRNGHLCTGVFIFMNEFGFVELSKDIEGASEKLEDYKFFDSSINQNIVFGDIRETKLYYMFKGVLLKDELDFQVCLNDATLTSTSDLSHMSVYPIMDWGKMSDRKTTIIEYDKQRIIHSNQLATNIINPIGSCCEYKIENGLLISKTELDELNVPKDGNPVSLYEHIGNIEDPNFEDSIHSNMTLTDNLEYIGTVIDASFQFEEAFANAQLLLEYPEDDLAKMIFEFSEAMETSFKPISEMVKQLSEKAQEVE